MNWVQGTDVRHPVPGCHVGGARGGTGSGRDPLPVPAGGCPRSPGSPCPAPQSGVPGRSATAADGASPLAPVPRWHFPPASPKDSPTPGLPQRGTPAPPVSPAWRRLPCTDQTPTNSQTAATGKHGVSTGGGSPTPCAAPRRLHGWVAPDRAGPLLGPEYGSNPTATLEADAETTPGVGAPARSAAPRPRALPCAAAGGVTRGTRRPSPRPRVSAARQGNSGAAPAPPGAELTLPP